MTTLQEAALTALAFIRWNEFGECRTPGFQGPTPTAAEAADALEDALAQQELPQKERTDFMAGYDAGMADAKRMAQQGQQQPVAWYEYNQDLDAWFLAYGHNPKAKTRPLVFGDTAAPAPQAQPATSDEWLVNCPQEVRDFANKLKAAPQAQTNQVLEKFDALQSAQPVAQPLSDSEIEKLREKTFSTYNPYCPVDSKSMRKAVRAAEAAHGIREVK